MRRLLAVVAMATALAVTGLVLSGPGAESSSTMRVDAIFDTAKGIVPGQVVKIAGARVGTIADVKLTSDYKARMVMDVPQQFAFRRDARCSIQPEGLISENFVQCDPGTPSEPALRKDRSGVPTVPVQRTTVPVNISDLFRIFQADVRQRFTVAIAAFGGGLAARGPDLNAAIRRANPTLAAVNRLLRQLGDQRTQLSAAVRDTDAVVADLTTRRENVADFITEANRVSQRTARRRDSLAAGIQRLPALLDATDTSLDALDDLTTRGRPLLADLRAAAPGLTRTLNAIGPFSRAATPALRELGSVATPARRSIRRAAPIVARLRTFAATALPVGGTLANVLKSLRDSGFVEQLNNFVYYGAAASARYDGTSHLFATNLILNECSTFATSPVAGCNLFYRDPQARADRKQKSAKPDAKAKAKAKATPTPSAVAGTPSAPAAPTAAPSAAPSAAPTASPLDPLLDALPQLTATPTPGRTPAPVPDVLGDLSDFLLGR